MERILFEGKVVGTGARVSGAHFFDGRRDYIITRIRDAEHAIYGHYSNDVELFVVDPDTVRRYPSLKDKQTASLQEWQKKCDLMHRENAQLRTELEQVKAERDAAIEDLKGMCEVINSCAFCIHDLRGTSENWPTIHCNNKDKRKCWIWRGFKAGDSE